MAAALSTYLAGVQQIVIAHDTEGRESGETVGERAIERAVAGRYLPFAMTINVTSDRRMQLASSLPFVAEMRPLGGRTAVYICRDFACRQPITTPEALEQELGMPA
jgi:uncharacterized protein